MSEKKYRGKVCKLLSNNRFMIQAEFDISIKHTVNISVFVHEQKMPQINDRIIFSLNERQGIQYVYSARNESAEKRGEFKVSNVFRDKLSSLGKFPTAHKKNKQATNLVIEPVVMPKREWQCEGYAHFYVVFNPMFNAEQESKETYPGITQAHSFAKELKERLKQELSHNTTEEDLQTYMYWGKLNVNEFRKLDINKYKYIVNKNRREQRPTHLYISDYQCLWVAKVEEVGTVNDFSDIKQNTLNFYLDKFNDIEIWFKISDMTIVASYMSKCAEELKKLQLYNSDGIVNDEDKGVSPYRSNIYFPAIVRDKTQQEWFNYNDRKLILNLSLDSHNEDGNSFFLEKIVNSYVIPQYIFEQLPPIVKEDILYAESLIVQNCKVSQRDNAMYRVVVKTYLLVIEIMLNEKIFKPICRKYGDQIKLIKDKAVCDAIQKKQGLTIGQFLSLNDPKNVSYMQFRNIVKEYCYSVEGDKLFRTYLGILDECKDMGINKIRNLLVHSSENKEQITKEDMIQIRNYILGVGCEGIINRFFSAFAMRKNHLKIVA